MSSNIASERSALVKSSSSCWSMISKPSMRKSKLISFCLTSARRLIKSATRNLFLHNTLFCILESVSSGKKIILVSTSLQTYHGIRTMLKRHITHLAFLGETSRFTPNHVIFCLSSCSSSVRVLLHSLVSIH